MSVVADSLGLTIVESLRGGQFGACVVNDPARGDDERLVLKAVDWGDMRQRWATGAAMAEAVRATGYPAPRYVGTGMVDRYTWSLQQWLPGAVPERGAGEHIERLVELVLRHADAAPSTTADTVGDLRGGMARNLEVLASNDTTRGLADDLRRTVERTEHVELRDGDVWHTDFHPYNVLVADGGVAIIDWEGARPGDYRLDLACLAITAPDDACEPAEDALRRVAPAEVAALCIAWNVAKFVGFDVMQRPQLIDRAVADIEARCAAWWRPLL